MNKRRIAVAICVVGIFAILALPGRSCAGSADAAAAANRAGSRDSGVKALIKEKKRKIKEERDAILAAGKRLGDARRTRDRAAIESAKTRARDEIAGRKAVISGLKDEIEVLQEGKESMAPGRRGRSEEGK